MIEFYSSHFLSCGNCPLKDLLMFTQLDYTTICKADSNVTLHCTLVQFYNAP